MSKDTKSVPDYLSRKQLASQMYPLFFTQQIAPARFFYKAPYSQGYPTSSRSVLAELAHGQRNPTLV